MYEVKNEASFRTVQLAHYTYAGDTHAAHLSSTLLYTLTKTGQKEKRSKEKRGREKRKEKRKEVKRRRDKRKEEQRRKDRRKEEEK